MIYAGVTGYAARSSRIGAAGGALQYIAPAGLATLRTATASLELAAVECDAVAGGTFSATGSLDIGTIAVLQVVGHMAPEAAVVLTLQGVDMDAASVGTGNLEGEIQAVVLDAVAAAMTADADLSIEVVALDAVGLMHPAGVGTIAIEQSALDAQAQMHAEIVAELVMEALSVVAEEATTEPEPEVPTEFWTPKEFGTTTWAQL